MPDVWPPDYLRVYRERANRLLKLRAKPEFWFGAREFYRTHPVEFIEDWCLTYDPRNATSETPARLPFILFKRQRELVEFLWAQLQGQECGLVEKTRDMGATWLCSAFSVWLWLFIPGASIGWGSRKQELVDRIGDPDSIFEKMRIVINVLPKELLPAGFNLDKYMTFMRIINPANDSTITGEVGDNIGRGGRKLIYFKDESAHYERPEKIEAALSDTTRVQIDISSVCGIGNVFHRKREAGVEWVPGQPAVKGKINVFIMDWRDHPAKTQEWYNTRRQKSVDEGLTHLFAQEVDRNYAAALQGIVIPGEWVAASIDAHLKLGFDDSGGWTAGLDVADEGMDRNALALRRGIILKFLNEWGDRDTGQTTRHAVDGCSGIGSDLMPVELQYDCIGIGAGVKAEANRLMAEGLMPKSLRFTPWHAGASALDPEGFVVQNADGTPDRKSPRNKDFYANLKAQGWWSLRRRFERTWRAINEPKFTWKPEQLISLPSNLPLLRSLQKELSQPTAGKDSKMRMLINKQPDGTKSPNLGDAMMMAYWPVGRAPLAISDTAMKAAQMGRRR